MSDVVIRCARNSDDFLKIAAAVYLTDPYIYPAAFGIDYNQAICAISKLMSVEKGLFHYSNFILALHEEEICGILLYNREGVMWDQQQCEEVLQGVLPHMENFISVSKQYFIEEATTPPFQHIEIIALCIMPKFRNRCVGKKLLSWMMEKYSEYTLTLDVLVNNVAAIKLYEKCGFKIIEEYKGFSLEESNRPDCYHMIKEPEYIGG